MTNNAPDCDRQYSQHMQLKSIRIAHDFLNFARKNNHNLSFDTFINIFKYKDNDANYMYVLVGNIILAADQWQAIDEVKTNV